MVDWPFFVAPFIASPNDWRISDTLFRVDEKRLVNVVEHDPGTARQGSLARAGNNILQPHIITLLPVFVVLMLVALG